MSQPHNPETLKSFAIEVLIDITLGIVLGIFVNQLTNGIAHTFGFGLTFKLLVQLGLIIIVLYVMKHDTKELFYSWYYDDGYGILFVALFLASQKNIMSFIEGIYHNYE